MITFILLINPLSPQDQDHSHIIIIGDNDEGHNISTTSSRRVKTSGFGHREKNVLANSFRDFFKKRWSE